MIVTLSPDILSNIALVAVGRSNKCSTVYMMVAVCILNKAAPPIA